MWKRDNVPIYGQNRHRINGIKKAEQAGEFEAKQINSPGRRAQILAAPASPSQQDAKGRQGEGIVLPPPLQSDQSWRNVPAPTKPRPAIETTVGLSSYLPSSAPAASGLPTRRQKARQLFP